MGGAILEHESRIIHNEGRKESRKEGWDLVRTQEKQAIAMRLYGKRAKVEDIARIVDASVNLVRMWIDEPARKKTDKFQASRLIPLPGEFNYTRYRRVP